MQKQFIPRRKDRRSAPLSFAQQRLWFLNQLEPESSAYNTAIALRLDGALNLGALSLALDAIVERHEVLRTTYAVQEGSDPIQWIGRPQVVEVPTVDLSDCPQSEVDGRVQRMVAELTERPFELSRDLMLRARLLRLTLEQHVLVVVIHHIASDGWSCGILWRELAAYYSAFSQGNSVSLPELPIQYADYAVWQREWLSGEVLASHLDYWKRQLQDLPTLQLPTDRPRPAGQSYRGSQQAFKLSGELTQELKKLSRQEGATLFMTLLAAFQTLLSRYSGQEDICIGSPIANRKYVEIEGLIGFFVNTLVLRSDLSGKPTFRELLSKVKWAALQSYAHQDLPFEKLVEELQPERNLGMSPLFQVMLALQNYPRNDFAAPGLAVSPMELRHNTAKFDLSLVLTETADGFEGRLEYSTDLFDPTTVTRMIFHFQTLLEGIVANPDQLISELPILTEPERHLLLLEWNDTKRDYPTDKCIHQLLEEQVERKPEAVAVVFEGQKLTYREMNNRANQLAHYLQKLGVGPEMLVGICMERSIEMVVGLLGILKAGGSYIPLDPTYPKQRLGFMLDDSQVSVLLTQQQLLDRLPEHGVQIVCMEKDREQIAQESKSNPVIQLTCQTLAFVLYTSGTTGTPKGVMINHRSLVNYLYWFNESPIAQSVQSLPVISRPTVDAILKQLFAPLLRGAQVWILPDEVVTQPAALLEALTTRTMVGLNCVPSLWRAVLDDLNPERASAATKSLSALLLGGEQLDRHLVDRTFAAMPDIEIWNLYGPTEATANACTGMITPCRALTIGRPIANTQLYVLDCNLQPVPIGVPGELHIGGDGLARGYLNRPELTREKFIANPFSADPASRLYKTGDLVRYLPDGNIEFLGRSDYQVKIRGFRIESGEVEAVLGQHRTVQSSVVMVREDAPGDQRLVGYVVARPDGEFDAAEVRKYLKQKLPEYMIPSALMLLDELPLTPNGKVDRRALPAPDQNRREFNNDYQAPRTPVEELLTQIWAEILRIEKIGVHDNFFDLGGHSLLATQVVSRMRAAFYCDIPLRSLFEAPTIEDLAAVITERQANKSDETDLKHILSGLEAMSDEEAERTLAQAWGIRKIK